MATGEGIPVNPVDVEAIETGVHMAPPTKRESAELGSLKIEDQERERTLRTPAVMERLGQFSLFDTPPPLEG